MYILEVSILYVLFLLCYIQITTSPLNKLKSVIKNETVTTLRLLPDIGNSNNAANFP